MLCLNGVNSLIQFCLGPTNQLDINTPRAFGSLLEYSALRQVLIYQVANPDLLTGDSHRPTCETLSLEFAQVFLGTVGSHKSQKAG